MKKILPVFVTIILAFFTFGHAEKLNLNLDQKKLLAGELQTFEQILKSSEGGSKKRVVGVILLDAPPTEVWKILSNWDNMNSFVKSLSYYKTIHVVKPLKKGSVGESIIEGKLKNRFVPVYTIDVKFDEPNLRQDYRLLTVAEINSLKQQNIKVQDPGSGIKNIEGFGYLEPYNNGTQTIYYYAPVIESSMPVPGWVETSITKSSLNEYMYGIRDKVKAK